MIHSLYAERDILRELVSNASDAQSAEAAPELIGQFGMCFYSAFMVAEK
jgi:HSP90 family molecular chaperone